jgi:hypothetical protein
MRQIVTINGMAARIALALTVTLSSFTNAFARDVEYNSGSGEIEVYVNVGEPTELVFEGGKIKDGFKNSNAGIALDKKDSSLVVFGKESMNENGEAILVRLDDGRSYPIRIRRANSDNPRDAQVLIADGKGAMGSDRMTMRRQARFQASCARWSSLLSLEKRTFRATP